MPGNIQFLKVMWAVMECGPRTTSCVSGTAVRRGVLLHTALCRVKLNLGKLSFLTPKN